MRRVLQCAAVAVVLAPALAGAVPSCPKSVKISVLRDGRFMVDGAVGTMPALNARFAALQQSRGVIWYYREGESDAALKTATPIIDAVIAHRLPISFSTKPDFSDVLVMNNDGTTRGTEPRKECERP